MGRSIVITQSNYLPWRGYFDMLRSVDQVILLESVQYTRRDWRNRNRIKTPDGLLWLTVPVEAKGRFDQAIDETLISDPSWASRHIRSIETAYRRAAHFDAISPWLFATLRTAAEQRHLSNVNRHLLHAICDYLGIAVPIRVCSDVLARRDLQAMEPTERLLQLCLTCGASQYVSGPAAKSYLDVEVFERHGIEVTWMDYSGYKEYPQLWGPFAPFVSVVDLIMNTGSEAKALLARSLQ